MGLIDRIKRALSLQPILFDTPQTVDMAPVYDAIGTVARCVDMIVHSCAKIPFIVVNETEYYYSAVKKVPKFSQLLKNPSTELSDFDFYKSIYRDLVFKGSALIYNTGLELQYIPDFSYEKGKFRVGNTSISPKDVIFINMLNSQDSIFAIPYIRRIQRQLDTINLMLKFEQQYYRNNGFPGFVLKSSRPLSTKIKEKYLLEFKNMYSIIQGSAGTPLVLDDDLDIVEFQKSFKELDFISSIQNLEESIYASLGVPKVLISSGNNANIKPNVDLFYNFTVDPFVSTVASALTFHAKLNYQPEFKNLKFLPDYSDIPILQSDYATRTNAIKSLYTVGIMSLEEARAQLKLGRVDPTHTFLIPVNIAGSAVDPTMSRGNE